ncbi:MAG: nitrous oxide reductase family maturation protein NosD [Alphaproteobacteria bacterium]|nr:MAG: nitrous oxide reductase family maturation protein NosD [Alphaproteobacteria bacterium]
MMLAVGLVLAAGAADARTRAVGPDMLAAALAAAAPGDVLRLAPGRYTGNFRITVPLTLEGETGAVLDGRGSGRVIEVAAPDVTIRGLTVTGSGTSLEAEDSGIFLTPEAVRAVVRGNRLENNLIGVYIKGARDALVAENVIVGRRDAHMNERGNGVQVWNAPGAVVRGNDFRYGRDGIFTTTSRDNRFLDNRFRDLRFAVHYMYTEDSEVAGNRSQGNHVGYALMYSRRIHVHDNLSRRDRDHGILLNYVLDSEIARNAVVDGGGKCVFIYNANINRITDNWFEHCRIGIHFTAGSERNIVSGNAFVGNRVQVKYVGTRTLDWSYRGRGNYWSDDPNFDLDDDGIGDRPYRPNGLVDRVLWAHPEAKLLMKSPALGLLRVAQERLPLLYPGGVVDTAPLMRPTRPLILEPEARS